MQVELEGKLRRQAQTIRVQQLALEEKNRALDTLHYVWCDGGCTSGVHRYDGQGPEAVTDEVVASAMTSLARILVDDTIQSTIKEDAIALVGRLIRWRRNRRWREVTNRT